MCEFSTPVVRALRAYPGLYKLYWQDAGFSRVSSKDDYAHCYMLAGLGVMEHLPGRRFRPLVSPNASEEEWERWHSQVTSGVRREIRAGQDVRSTRTLPLVHVTGAPTAEPTAASDPPEPPHPTDADFEEILLRMREPEVVQVGDLGPATERENGFYLVHAVNLDRSLSHELRIVVDRFFGAKQYMAETEMIDGVTIEFRGRKDGEYAARVGDLVEALLDPGRVLRASGRPYVFERCHKDALPERDVQGGDFLYWRIYLREKRTARKNGRAS